MRGNRAVWSTALLALIAIFILNALVGSATSPVERLLGIHHVPRWWPYVLAGGLGLLFGALVNRGKAPKGAPAQNAPAARGRHDDGARRGRHHIPRHIRRARERQARREARVSAAAPTAPVTASPTVEGPGGAAPRRRWPWRRA